MEPRLTGLDCHYAIRFVFLKWKFMASSPEKGGSSEVPFAQLVTPRAAAPNFVEIDRKTSQCFSDQQKLASKFSFLDLYRFATPWDRVLTITAVLMAAVNGALFPCIALVFGKAIGAFAQVGGGVDRGTLNSAALDYFLIAIGLFVTDYLAYLLFSLSAERQMKALRARALQHMLYMDIAWYDLHDPLQLSTRITGDTVKIKDGMGEKLGNGIKYICQFVTGYIIGLARGWDTTLVMTCVIPVMGWSMGFVMKKWQTRATYAQQVYAQAGAVAEETLGAIRTVSSLTAEQRALDKYNQHTAEVEKGNIQQSRMLALMIGLCRACDWLMYAAGLWYGGSKVWRGEASPKAVFQALMGILMGMSSIGLIFPNLTAILEAKGAAVALYGLLDTQSHIDASQADGVAPDSCSGRIEVVNVSFAYPSRPDAPILRDYSVTIESGQTVAFVEYDDRSYLSSLPHRVTVYGCLYIAGAAVLFLGRAAQSYGFQYMAETLTARLRGIHFSSLCRQNIGFFDRTENATGALTADLATDALRVAVISGETEGRLFQAIFTTVAALLISFLAGSWLLSLVMLAIIPFLVLGNMFRGNNMRGKSILADDMAEVGAHASEVLGNIRTVVSLGLESSSCDKFSVLLDAPMKSGERDAQVNGLAVGFSSFIVFATYAFAFWYGGKLVDDGSISFLQLMRSLMAIIMSSITVGGSIGYLADTDSAFEAGGIILSLRDRPLPIDSFGEEDISKLETTGTTLRTDKVQCSTLTRKSSNIKNFNLITFR
ncbi:ATP-dependent translocase ABCB1 [Phytophthora ramorum]|uniref:ATP-dependent translocase ABCB1 n=1 Tax=Phytophthora ramorum TaxID=164328 RepID=UPI003098559A|nr:ATP-dependent translocase ABCB1 [Phytophthora ramorum]